MILKKKRRFILKSLTVLSFAVPCISSSWAQIHTPFLSHQQWLKSAEEQYNQQLFHATNFSAEKHLLNNSLFFLNTDPIIQSDKATFLKNIAAINNGLLLNSSYANVAYTERIAFAAARNYFKKGMWANAIQEYTKAGIANLSNKEIATSKFELAYCYFNNKQFNESKSLLTGIKDLQGPYSNNAQYYYGLLAYNEGDYKSALKSFEKIEHIKAYQDVVPYYIAEILYFDGQKAKSLQKSKDIISDKSTSFYKNEAYLLAAQCIFETGKYQDAIPYFEYYYKNVDKIRKQDLYKMGYCYYETKQWDKAIEPFKLLSNVQDNLGQNAMYLLGDCYLKLSNKPNAKNAFSLCSQMPFNESLTEISLLSSGKLAFELGYQKEGHHQLEKLINDFPNSELKPEATNILSEQLLQSANYGEAYQMLMRSNAPDQFLLQKSAYGFAIQNMQQNNWADAEKLLNESLKYSTDKSYEAAALFWKAEINYRNKNYDSAIANGKNFIATTKSNENTLFKHVSIQNALLTLGYSSLNIQDFKAARQYFAQAQDSKTNSSSYSDKLASDAALREADAAFLDKDYSKASELYTKTIAQNASDADYARFQKSTLLGLQGKSAEQAEMLLEMIAQKNPESKYKYEAHYALGDLHLDANKYEDAINHFQKINEQTAKHLAAKALMKIGFAYQEADNNNKAIESYKKVILQYPNSEQRNAALEALKDLYISSNQPKAYVELLKENNLSPTDNAGLDSLYYAAAETQFAASKYDKSALAMHDYLQQYPQGIFKTKANFYKAESHYQLKQYDSAIKYYNNVLNEAWSDFTEPSALKASSISSAQNNFIASEKYYALLRNNAIGKENLTLAYHGLMISAQNQNKYDIANNYADTLLSIPELNEQNKNEAILVKANAALNSKKYDEANKFFEQVTNAKSIDIAAEAHYRLAEILMLQNSLNPAEKATENAIQKTTNSNYWNTKSYLLMADIFILQKDYFNAKATLQSIVKNVKIEVLKKEALAKLEQVKSLEKIKSKLSEG